MDTPESAVPGLWTFPDAETSTESLLMMTRREKWKMVDERSKFERMGPKVIEAEHYPII
jgi:hypothetical protein